MFEDVSYSVQDQSHYSNFRGLDIGIQINHFVEMEIFGRQTKKGKDDTKCRDF